MIRFTCSVILSNVYKEELENIFFSETLNVKFYLLVAMLTIFKSNPVTCFKVQLKMYLLKKMEHVKNAFQ